MGKVENFLLENDKIRNAVIDEIEVLLCKNGVFYTKVDNEIHFLDRIYRFYLKSEVIVVSAVIVKKSEKILSEINLLANEDKLFKFMDEGNCVIEEAAGTRKPITNYAPTFNKKKNNNNHNKMINKILKRSNIR